LVIGGKQLTDAMIIRILTCDVNPCSPCSRHLFPSRMFQRHLNALQLAGLGKSRDVFLPGFIVEVGSQEAARFFGQKRVYAHDMVAPEVFGDLLVGDRDKSLVSAFAASCSPAGTQASLLLAQQDAIPLVQFWLQDPLLRTSGPRAQATC
jgi:hypothetical protein